jgi:hypothetical protein
MLYDPYKRIFPIQPLTPKLNTQPNKSIRLLVHFWCIARLEMIVVVVWAGVAQRSAAERSGSNVLRRRIQSIMIMIRLVDTAYSFGPYPPTDVLEVEEEKRKFRMKQ